MKNWQSRAACRGVQADSLFFPASPQAQRKAAEDAENLFCGQCPVRADCLTSAIAHKDSGIRAGTTEETREKLFRTRNRIKCPVCKNKELAQVSKFAMCLACGASWRGERPTI